MIELICPFCKCDLIEDDMGSKKYKTLTCKKCKIEESYLNKIYFDFEDNKLIEIEIRIHDVLASYSIEDNSAKLLHKGNYIAIYDPLSLNDLIKQMEIISFYS